MKYKDVEFNLKDSFIQRFKWNQPQWGPLGYFTYKRTYSRPITAQKSEEFWQTLQRVTEGCFVVQKQHCANYHLPWNERVAQKSAQEMYQRMWDFKFLPPGRGLWAMGSEFAFEKGGACLQNCGFVSTVDLAHELSSPFVWLMDMSLLGVGVGFDTRGAFQEKEVFLREPRTTKDPHVVEDSREGWVAVFKRILDAYDGKDSMPAEFVYDEVRPEGSIIKGFGGIAPGPGPLKELVTRTVTKLNEYLTADKPVDSTLIVDLMNFAGAAVVAGGIRRSSEIALGTMEDEEFNDLKSNGYLKDKMLARWASNNTHIVHKGDDYIKAAKRTAENGEPGYFWVDNARKYGRMKDRPNWKDRRVMGTNPSMPKGTLIATKSGIFPIESLENKSFLVKSLDGKWASAYCSLSGTNETVLGFKLAGGVVVYSTKKHRWPVRKNQRGDYKIEKKFAKDIKIGDLIPRHRLESPGIAGDITLTEEEGFFLGYLLGDGWISTRSKERTLTLGISLGIKSVHLGQRLVNCLNSFGANCNVTQRQTGEHTIQTSNQSVIHFIINRFGWCGKQELPTKIWTSNDSFIKGVIDGLISSDGSVDNKTGRISLSNSNLTLVTSFSKLISFFGLNPSIYSTTIDTPSFPNGKNYNKIYKINQVRMSGLLYNESGLSISHKTKQETLIKTINNKSKLIRNATVKRVFEVKEKQPVWDISVAHPQHVFPSEYVYTGNCGEQSLESYELCCLAESFPIKHDSKEDYFKTLKYAYLYAKTVTLLRTHDSRTNQVMTRNRRIGLSQSGIVENINRLGFREHMVWCNDGYEVVKQWDKAYSEWLGVPESIKKTTVKPSGSVSLLPGVTPGVHYPHAEYYIRRIRVAKTSHLIEAMKTAGYNVEPDIKEPEYTMVVSFPVHEPNFSKRKEDVYMYEQLELAAQMQAYWSDNQVSVTVTVDEEEGQDIATALSMYETRLKSVSFLPLEGHNYEQAPYEEITQEQYEKMAAGLKRPKLNIGLDDDGKSFDKFCDSVECEI